jgi:hypothetical protein
MIGIMVSKEGERERHIGRVLEGYLEIQNPDQHTLKKKKKKNTDSPAESHSCYRFKAT